MDRKIFKTGHSLAVTVSKKLLEELGLKIGDTIQLEVDKDKQQIVIHPSQKKVQLVLNLKDRKKLGSKL